jgi:putative transposase
MIPHKDRIVIEVVYNIEIPDQKPDNKRVISIDLGVNNLAAVCNNMGYPAFIVNGKPLKSINQFYNKKISHYRSLCKRMNNKNYSNEMNRLTKKRNSKMNDYMHKASRFIVDYCVTNQINTIIIGKNKGWKQNVSMGNVVNQNFVQIPFNRFISMIQYKANEQGIAVVITEESYTSGTSFIDNEKPTRAKYNKARRVKRGLFISNKGISINADLNGAYQIMKKVFPIKWDSGCALHPVVVNLNS